MILSTSEIAGMTAQEEADLVEKRSAQMKESRYEAAISLALLKRSNEYAELGFRSADANDQGLSAAVLIGVIGAMAAAFLAVATVLTGRARRGV